MCEPNEYYSMLAFVVCRFLTTEDGTTELLKKMQEKQNGQSVVDQFPGCIQCIGYTNNFKVFLLINYLFN
jgi:hypothetical protein